MNDYTCKIIIFAKRESAPRPDRFCGTLLFLSLSNLNRLIMTS